MTSVDFRDRDGNQAFIEEVYKIPKQSVTKNAMTHKPLHIDSIDNVDEQEYTRRFITTKEQAMIKYIEEQDGVVNGITTIGISDRRYKRKRAKILKRLNKKMM